MKLSHIHTFVPWAMFALVRLAGAQTGGNFDLSWNVVDSGGGVTTGASFELTSALGQVATATLANGEFTLTGGFIAGLAIPRCVADTDDGTGTGTPDGGVTIDDLLFYLNLYTSGDSRGDVDDGSGTGTPDGGVTIDDLLYYLQRFEVGC